MFIESPIEIKKLKIKKLLMNPFRSNAWGECRTAHWTIYSSQRYVVYIVIGSFLFHFEIYHDTVVRSIPQRPFQVDFNL